MRKKKTKILGLCGVSLLVIAIAGRIYLPYWATDYVNEKINALDGYGGGVEDIDIHLWRGAYQIHGLDIYKENGGLQEPFTAINTVDLSIEWGALFEGAIVAEIDLHEANLNFSKTQTGEGAGWIGLVDALSPFDINRMEVHGGKVSYIDYTATPNVNIFVDDIQAKITNLRNVEDRETALPSDLLIAGSSIGGGTLDVDSKMNILQEVPDFDVNMSLSEADITALNDYAKEFAAIDFQSGTIGIFGELAAANGNVTGYVKPVATNLSLVDIDDGDSNPFNLIWESLASVVLEIFENQPADQFALRMPIEGNIDDPDRDVWSAIISIFKNAFAGAFTKSDDGTIEFNDALLMDESEQE